MLATQDIHSTPLLRARQTLDAEALRFIPILTRTAGRLTHNRDDADDLVQDTYVTALRFADRFRQGSNLKAWLFTVLRNTHRNLRRRAVRNPLRFEGDTVSRILDPTDPADDPEQRLLSAGRVAELHTALEAVPSQFKNAIWLRDVDGYSYSEIAHIADIPIGTVMSRISRGRRMVAQRLADGDTAERPLRQVGSEGES